ncbi:MAG: sulfatase-like hydrolase/transferase, partial [Planctomycetota bacterium]
PSKAPLPSYHPDLPEVRRDWAQYYDKLSQMDKEVGKILRGLEEDGLADSTIIFYYGDHGSGMPRSKRWPFNSGLHVPLIVHVPKAYQSLAPEDYQAGGESERLVSFVDFAPTLLSIADRPAGESMQGVAFLGKRSGPAKDYLVGFRGRMDERVDNVRSITDGRYVYMKHFYPDRPYLKHVEYMFQTPTTAVWKSKFDAGELTDAQAKFWQNKPHEELFDLQADPDETINLATQEKYADKVEELRGALMSRLEAIKDVGIYPEPMMLDLCGDEAPYDVVREKGTSFKRLVDIAFTMTGTTTTKPGLNPERIQRLAESGQALARYYAARGASLSGDIATLEKVIGDKNPTVAVAASEGLRRHGDKAQRDAAATRILEIIQSGSFHDLVVVDALNVADRDKELFDTLAKSSKELKSSQKKGSRTGKYIARLQDYIQRNP